MSSAKFSNMIAGVAIAVFAMGTQAWGDKAHASPYEAGETRPGTVVTNTVQVKKVVGAADILITDASVSFTVAPKREPASLGFYVEGEASPAGLQSVATSTMVQQSFYSSSNEAVGPWEVTPASRSGQKPYSGFRHLRPEDRIDQGTPLFAILTNNALNYDANALDRAMLTFRDSQTGDTELLTVVETGNDTGIFAALICTCGDVVRATDGLISTMQRSVIEVLYADPYDSKFDLQDEVTVGPLDPTGFAFDSRTGSPVDGVTVTIMDATTGKPANVLGDDFSSQYPSTVITGAEAVDSSGRRYPGVTGRYRFPHVAPGTYYFEVTPPDGYLAPTKLTNEQLDKLSNRELNITTGSRLEPFEIYGGAPIEIDLPLDGAAVIEVLRTGSADVLSVGDHIRFDIRIKAGERKALMVDLRDALPQGLSFDEASLRIDDESAQGEAHVSPDGQRVLIEDITLGSDGEADVSYVARVTTAAQGQSELESSSTAEASGLLSNTSRHILSISEYGGFARAAVIGQIFTGTCEAPTVLEDGLAEIRVFAEDGTYSDTDAAGRFTFRRLSNGTHVMRLDELSLPDGYEPMLCENSTRRAGSATSTFVEIRAGFVQQVSFFLRATQAAGPDVVSKKEEKFVNPSIASFGPTWLSVQTRGLGIAFPADGHLPEDQSLDLAVVRTSVQVVEAKLNGSPIAAVYKRPSISSGERTMDTWRGVELKKGRNEVHVTIRTFEGAVVKDEVIHVFYADDLARLDVVEEKSQATSNGRSEPVIAFRAVDTDGIPLHPGALIKLNVERPFAFSPTVHGEAQQIAATKLQSITAEVRQNGIFTVQLARTRRSGLANFSVTTDGAEVTQRVYVSAENRPWLLVGLADGTAAHSAVAQHMMDPREKTLGEIAGMTVSGRVALFAEGVISGRWLATIRLDTGIPGSERDFFSPDPDAQYVVFSDRSQGGDVAQSRHALYLKLESDSTEILYGDFDTALTKGQATYSRRLTGGRVIWGDEKHTLTTFAASTSQSFAEDEFPANGTSGPFYLRQDEVVPFSETVSIVEIDRVSNDEVEAVTLQRGKDYDIDYASGRIFLTKPLLSRTDGLNRNLLRVAYEVEVQDVDGAIIGMRGERKISDTTTAGVTAIHESNVAGTDGSGQVVGADVHIEVTETLTADVSLAVSHQSSSTAIEDDRSSHSAEMRLNYDNEDSTAEAYLRSKGTAFGISNTTPDDDTVVSAGIEADILMSKSLEDADLPYEKRIRLAASTELNAQSQKSLSQAEATWVKTEARLERGFGARVVHQDDPAKAEAATSGALKALGLASWKSEDERVELTFGQEITLLRSGAGTLPDVGVISGAFQVTERLTLRASNEMSRTENATGNVVVGGFDYTPWEGGTASTGLSNATGQGHSLTAAQMGFDQSYALNETVTLTGGVDRQFRISGDAEDASPIAESGLGHPSLGEAYTAISAGINYSDEQTSMDALAEQRWGESKDSTRVAARGSHEVGLEKAIGLSASSYRETGQDGETKTEREVVASAAHRPTDQRYAVLDRLALTIASNQGEASARIANTIQITKKLGNGDELNLRQGLKWASYEFSDRSHSDVTGLLGAEYRHDINEWLDVGAHGSAMYSFGHGDWSQSYGGSIGLTPFEDGWVSLGYNIEGFADPDFSKSGYTDHGPFLQFRTKFDQKSLSKVFGR